VLNALDRTASKKKSREGFADRGGPWPESSVGLGQLVLREGLGPAVEKRVTQKRGGGNT